MYLPLDEFPLFDRSVCICRASGMTVPELRQRFHWESPPPQLTQCGDIGDLNSPDYMRWIYGVR